MGYTVTLMDCPVKDADKREAEEQFSGAIERYLGNGEAVRRAYLAYQDAFERAGELPLPAEASDADRDAVALWEKAEALGTVAALGDWHGWKTGQMGGAHFEINL